jgi:hypothetical protein
VKVVTTLLRGAHEGGQTGLASQRGQATVNPHPARLGTFVAAYEEPWSWYLLNALLPTIIEAMTAFAPVCQRDEKG